MRISVGELMDVKDLRELADRIDAQAAEYYKGLTIEERAVLMLASMNDHDTKQMVLLLNIKSKAQYEEELRLINFIVKGVRE